MLDSARLDITRFHLGATVVVDYGHTVGTGRRLSGRRTGTLLGGLTRYRGPFGYPRNHPIAVHFASASLRGLFGQVRSRRRTCSQSFSTRSF